MLGPVGEREGDYTRCGEREGEREREREREREETPRDVGASRR